MKVFRNRKITCLCLESNPGQSSSSRSAARLRSDLLCPCCTFRAMQAGGDTHSKMAPTIGTHSILVPGTKTAHFTFYYLLLSAYFEVLSNFCSVILTQNGQCVMLVWCCFVDTSSVEPVRQCSLTFIYLLWWHDDTGHAVAQLVRYKPEGRVFDSQLCHWDYSLTNPSSRTMALGSTQPLTKMNTRNISWG